MAHGEKVGETWRFTCPTSANGTTKRALVSGNAFHRLPRWWLQLSKKIKSDDEHIAIRSKYGDTTSVEAHLKALRELGLQAEFRKDGDADMVELEVENGRPVLVGWLHHGNMLRGEPPMCNGLGCGHWSVISGYAGKNSSDPEWIMQDPRGLPDMERGGHSNPHLGRNARVRQAAFYQRWQVNGPARAG